MRWLTRTFNALRNYEYLSKNPRNMIPDGFTLFGAPTELQKDQRYYSPGGVLPFFNPSKLERIDYKVEDWVKYTRFPEKAHGGHWYIGSFQYREIDGYGLEERLRKQRWRERLWMALFGGAALIGPTLSMSLSPGLITSLVTPSLATLTLLFTLALAKFAKSSTEKDVLGATAAYAAVRLSLWERAHRRQHQQHPYYPDIIAAEWTKEILRRWIPERRMYHLIWSFNFHGLRTESYIQGHSTTDAMPPTIQELLKTFPQLSTRTSRKTTLNSYQP
jgi:hypothetical protein